MMKRSTFIVQIRNQDKGEKVEKLIMDILIMVNVVLSVIGIIATAILYRLIKKEID